MKIESIAAVICVVCVGFGVFLEGARWKAQKAPPPPPPVDLCLQRIIFNECLNKVATITLVHPLNAKTDPVTACGERAAAMSVRPASEIPPYCKE